jgi:retinol-binding protein 3
MTAPFRKLIRVVPAVLLTSSLLGAQAPIAPSLTGATRAAVLDSVRALLQRVYVDADTGRRLASHLATRQRARAYDSLSDPLQFARRVTADVRSLNDDKHLVLIPPGAGPRGGHGGGAGAPRIVMQGPGASGAGATPPSDAAGQRVVIMAPPDGRDAARRNFGLRKVEVLDGNIGYLEVAGFDGAEGANEAIGHALRLLEHTDAIIVDVRRNGGGSGEMSHMLFSHFLDATPVPTVRVRDRSDGSDTVLTSVANVPGPRRTTVPLYVLTSNFSASAAEEFAFVLRNKGRATIVGERTAGAGHMNHIIDVGHGFQFSVSFSRVSDPVTGAEWERVGVPPTIATDAASALSVAHRHALDTVAAKRSRPGDGG